MAQVWIMRGKYVLTDPRKKENGVVREGAIAIEGDRIRSVGAFEELKTQNPGARVLGNGKQLLMPGLVDAHSHGRGMSPIQKGVKNDFLENALFDWAYMHLLPPELCAGMTAYHHLRSGSTSLAVCISAMLSVPTAVSARKGWTSGLMMSLSPC